MGCLFGGRLSRVTDVWLVDPWPEHVAAMQRQGLHLIEPEGEQVIPVQATTDPRDVREPVDLAIIFVKSHQTEMAASIAKQLLAPDGLALTLQNGLGNLEVIARVVGEDRAVQGVTSHGATLLGPGRVRHAGRGPTHLALTPQTERRVRAVAELFRQAGFEVHLSDDLDSIIWGKLVINVGINPLTALLRVPNGALVEIDAARALMRDAVTEAVRVAAAKGIQLPYADPLAQVEAVCRATAENRSSMLQDVLRGAPTEIQAINGAVVHEGLRVGVETPVNALIVRFIKAVEASYEKRVEL
jgi:2-dehydropantoate 2-reductase